jgi:hypothetical protein
MELSLMELGAEKSEAEGISAALTRIVARALQNDPARTARSLSEFVAVFNDTVAMIQGRQVWEIECALQRSLAEEDG